LILAPDASLPFIITHHPVVLVVFIIYLLPYSAEARGLPGLRALAPLPAIEVAGFSHEWCWASLKFQDSRIKGAAILYKCRRLAAKMFWTESRSRMVIRFEGYCVCGNRGRRESGLGGGEREKERILRERGGKEVEERGSKGKGNAGVAREIGYRGSGSGGQGASGEGGWRRVRWPRWKGGRGSMLRGGGRKGNSRRADRGRPE
jgi:hypothetical protein